MPDDARKAFQSNLLYYMNLKKISQQDIANTLGVSKSTVSDWCRGKNYPRIDVMQKLSDMLGVVMVRLTTQTDHGEETVLDYYRSLSEEAKKRFIKSLERLPDPDDVNLILAYHVADPGTQAAVRKLLDIPEEKDTASTAG